MITDVTRTDAEEVIALIGKLNYQEIKVVQEALTARSRFLRGQEALANKATLTPGTQVITRGLKPKYLNGLPGTVVDKESRRKGDIMVAIDAASLKDLELIQPGAQRFFGHGGTVGVPASCLKRLGHDD
jgi:hypothetical protein